MEETIDDSSNISTAVNSREKSELVIVLVEFFLPR